ncbi:MAG: T9SS type A sorting domain-containing protein [candidate division WOR-3 bacterium]
MLPFLYWTNLSGVHDGVIYKDTIYLATFGGILVLNKNLDSLKTYKFSDGTNSNIIVAIDTFKSRIYYLTKNKGFGYIQDGKVYHYPKSQIPISDLSNGKGLFPYNNYLFIYGNNWILYFVGNTLKFIDVNVYNIKPPIGSIFVYNDTIYIGDSIGYLKTYINNVDIPASYQRINMPKVNFINVYNGNVLFGTINGIYDKNGNLVIGGFSAIYFTEFRDTLFISSRNLNSSEIYGQGILKKFKDNNLLDEPNYLQPYFIMPIDTFLIISRFHNNSLSIYVDNVAWGIYTYPSFKNYKYGFPFNYISNIITLKDIILVFTHSDYDYNPNNLNYIGFLVNKNKIIELGDSVYRITKAIKINDSLIGVSSYFSYFIIDTIGNVNYCIAVPVFPVDPDKAFTSLTIYKDTILISNFNGVVYKIDGNCSIILNTPYSNSAGHISDIEVNNNLVAVGGDNGLAIFENGSLIYKNSNISVNTIEKYNEGFLVGTSGGLYFYNQDSLKQVQSLSNLAITDIVIDKFNSIFTLTENGLYRLDESFQIIERYDIAGKTYFIATNFPILHTLSILNDTLLLVGSSEGVGLIRINSLIEGELILYPNPAKNYIKVKNLKGSFDYNVEIITLSGKRVFKGSFKSNSSGEITIDISNLNKGFYILKISNKLLKFVKV